MGFAKLDVFCDNVVRNIRAVKNAVAPNTKILVVSKANAYGLGAAEICKRVQHEVDYFGFATIEEAIEVRKAGTSKKLFLLSEPLKRDISKVVEFNLVLGVYRNDFIQHLNDYVKEHNPDTPIETHFKLDTGLHRLGCQEPIKPTLDFWLNQTSSKILKAGLWSHLQNAEHGEDSIETNELQYAAFTSLSDQHAKDHPDIIRHLSNSFATDSLPAKYHFDMVRPGVIIWKNTFRLTVLVKHVFRPEKGQHVGYGFENKYISDGTEKMATLGIGYGDGLSTLLSHKGDVYVLIKGVRCFLASAIMMDMCIVRCPADLDVQPEDEAIFLSDGSDDAMTTSYLQAISGENSRETMTHFGRRIERVYHDVKDVRG